MVCVMWQTRLLALCDSVVFHAGCNLHGALFPSLIILILIFGFIIGILSLCLPGSLFFFFFFSLFIYLFILHFAFSFFKRFKDKAPNVCVFAHQRLEESVLSEEEKRLTVRGPSPDAPPTCLPARVREIVTKNLTESCELPQSAPQNVCFDPFSFALTLACVPEQPEPCPQSCPSRRRTESCRENWRGWRTCWHTAERTGTSSPSSTVPLVRG